MAGSDTKSLKDRQREERAALIIRVAYEVLVEKGYYEASMDEIAARVGISKGALYLHFKSKEELIFLLIEQETAKFIGVMEQIIAQETTARARLQRILQEAYRAIHGGRQFLFALHSIGLTGGAIRDRLAEKVGLTGLIGRLEAVFEAGQRARELDADTPPAVMVSVFLGLLEMYSADQTAINQFSPDALAGFVSRIFFDGLMAKP
jgi:AcrR family transcriptional regulator